MKSLRETSADYYCHCGAVDKHLILTAYKLSSTNKNIVIWLLDEIKFKDKICGIITLSPGRECSLYKV